MYKDVVVTCLCCYLYALLLEKNNYHHYDVRGEGVLVHDIHFTSVLSADSNSDFSVLNLAKNALTLRGGGVKFSTRTLDKPP